MQKMIKNKEYDTSTASLIGAFTEGCYGDAAGYEEKLMQTPGGDLFMYGLGGPASPYPVETIKSVTRPAAEKWMSNLG